MAKPVDTRALAGLSTVAFAAVSLALAGCTSPTTPETEGEAAQTSPSAHVGGTPGTASGAGSTGPDTASAPTPVAKPTTIASGLKAPWSIAFAGKTALVSERDSGRILEVLGDGKTRTVGTVAGVEPGGEGGLLGLAVRGDRLYAHFTAGDGNRIVSYRLTGKPGGLALAKPTTLLDKIPSAGVHNGGRLAFGPDGMLYATMGDATDSDNAQDPDSLAGKILRMTPDGKVPADNPTRGSLVFSMGHRNPQGLAWDTDGTMYAAEFGQDTWDELNIIKPGANYGWPEAEGIAKRKGFADPIAQWRTADASPSGMAIVGGTAFIANLAGERLRTVRLSAPEDQHEYYAGDYGRLRLVVRAPDGALWMLTNNTDGRGTPAGGDDRILKIAG